MHKQATYEKLVFRGKEAKGQKFNNQFTKNLEMHFFLTELTVLGF